MDKLRITEIMTGNPAFIAADATLQHAASLMRTSDCGVLPVGTNDFVEGIITDRDIVLRAVAVAKDPAKEQVRDYMTHEIFTCMENDTLEYATAKMYTHQVNRLLVKNHKGDISGVLALGSILRNNINADKIGKIIELAIRPEHADFARGSYHF